MTVEDFLSECRAKEAAATAGPWTLGRGNRPGMVMRGKEAIFELPMGPDAEFVVFARAALPRLLVMVEESRKALLSTYDGCCAGEDACGNGHHKDCLITKALAYDGTVEP